MSHHTRTQYIVANGQREFDLAAPYLNRDHITITVNGAAAMIDWLSDSRFRLFNPAPDGAIVLVRRRTPIDQALVTFHNGSNLTEQELNRAVRQLLFRQQEQEDFINGSLDQAVIRVGNNLGISTDPTQIANELLMVSELGDDLLNRFRAALTDVDENGESLIDHTLKLTNQAFRLDNLTHVVDALANLETGGLATIIQNEAQERLNGDTALANTMALIGAKSGDGLSFILDTNKVKASPTETLAQRFSALYAADGSNLALIQSEQTARVNADTAMTSRLDTMGARVNANEAAVVNEATARATAISAEAAARQAVSAKVDSNFGLFQNEVTARTTATDSLAQTLALLGAKNAGGSAFILDLSKTQVGAGTSLGSRLSGIDTALGQNSAAIASEGIARTTATDALAQQLTTLNVDFNGQKGSITSLQNIVSGPSGLTAKIGLAINVNGVITGWSANNNGRTGTMSIMANVFSIVDPNNGNPFVPFEISGGVTRIRNALIDNLDMSRLGSGLYNGEMRLGLGKIVFDNGTVMRVQGVGFGSQSQFLTWFGPTMAINLCSEANAISYEKSNGDAYFGGSLSAGILTNKITASSMAVGVVAETAFFGSNGGTITVVASGNFGSSGSRRSFTNPGDNSGTNGPTVLELWRKIGAAAYAQIATINVVGSWTRTVTDFADDHPDGPYWIATTSSASGAITYTDPSRSTSDRQYKLVVRSRSGMNTAGAGSSTSERMTIIATEQ